jgi:hypothetical protein
MGTPQQGSYPSAPPASFASILSRSQTQQPSYSGPM